MRRPPTGAHRAGPAAPIAIAAAAAAVTLAACGGDDDALSREQFLAEGDEICASAREQYAEQQRDPPRTASEAADLTENLIEISTEELDSIRDLESPDGLRERLDRYLAAREQGIEVMREGLEAAEAGDARAYADAQAKVARRQVERTRLAKEVGLTECSRPLGAPAPE